MSLSSSAHNRIVATRFRANWIGLFTGENQTKAVERVLTDLNRSGLGCCALAQDQWNPFVRL